MYFKLKKHVRYNPFAVLATILVFGVTILYYAVQKPTFISWRSIDNITCHYENAGDALRAAESMDFPAKSIFFLETSCRGDLTTRQACTVESAARAHPEWQINILFAGPVTKDTLSRSSLSVLKTLKNVNIARIHLHEFTEGTPLESLVRNGKLNESLYPVVHTSDVLRLLTLYKWGGVYLDLDVVVVKSLEPLGGNWAAREDDDSIANGIIALSMDPVGRAVAEAAVREMGNNFRGDLWSHNGPALVTKVLTNMCSSHKVIEMTAKNCKGFEIYPPTYFYPVHWTEGKTYFEPGDLKVKYRETFGYHVWNAVTKNMAIPKDCPFAKLAQQYCPTIYSHYGKEFGT